MRAGPARKAELAADLILGTLSNGPAPKIMPTMPRVKLPAARRPDLKPAVFDMILIQALMIVKLRCCVA